MANQSKDVKEREFDWIYGSFFGWHPMRFLPGVDPNTILEVHPNHLIKPNGTPISHHLTNFRVDEQVVIKDYTYRVACVGDGYLVVEPVGPVILGQNKSEP